MPQYELKESAASLGSLINLYKITLGPRGKVTSRLVHSYSPQEQYPLGSDRYYNDRPNLFLDILDLLDGHDWEDASSQKESAQVRTSSDQAGGEKTVHLRTLCERSLRKAADGSGNARRFKDARSLWNNIQSHASRGLVRPQDNPIVEVRRSHNWKRNQPFKDVPADPQAWLVISVYSRSNPRKDSFCAFRGLPAALEALSQSQDQTQSKNAAAFLRAMEDNADYPTYGQVAALLEDSNMIVFHNDASFSNWLRQQTRGSEEIFRETPVEVTVEPDPSLPEEDPSYLPPQSRLTVGRLAKILAQEN